jgi:alanine racemase
MNNVNNSLSVLTVTLSKIVRNYQKASLKAKGSKISAIVKADAYSLGAVPIAKALFENGCTDFYVASVDEAIELRKDLPSAVIHVLNGVNKGEEYYFLEYKIIPVLNRFDQVELWNDTAEKLGVKLPANLFFDTGMNRLGMSSSEISEIKKILLKGNIKVQYIMSHLACAHFPNHQLNEEQLTTFKEIAKQFPGIKTSFSNSDGMHLGDKFLSFDQIRVGIILYGLCTNVSGDEYEQAIELHSEIIQLRKIEKDGAIGYSATEEVKKGMKIAVIPIGYADAYYFRQAKKTYVSIDGHMAPTIGLASMDLITIDITNIPEQYHKIGQKVELIGKNISIETVAKMSDTIIYGILTSLGSRFKRDYVYL